MMDPLVCIYMSTYNGKEFLGEQIESILNQQGVRVFLCIRDDGSSDGTVDFLKELEKKHPNVNVVFGENVGFELSFAEASRIRIKADFYAFSDQDDVWKSDRLIRAIKIISASDNEKPVLYGSNFFITNDSLEVSGPLIKKRRCKKVIRKLEKYGFFYDNLYACTMVWNPKLQDILCRFMPDIKVSQDVWTQLIAEINDGNVIFDSSETIFHRIHSNNAAGIQKHAIKRIKKGISLYIKSDKATKNELVNLALMHYRTLDSNVSRTKFRDLIKNYNASLRKKLALIFYSLIVGEGIQRKLFRVFLILKKRY